MKHKEYEELKKSLVFFEPWLQWHIDDCVQDDTCVSWYKDEADERYSFAVFQLTEAMSKNIEAGDPFTLKLIDLRTGRKLDIRGVISIPPTKFKYEISGSMEDVVVQFVDRFDIYLTYRSDNVTIINAALYSVYIKQLENISRGIKKMIADRFLSTVFINNKYRMSAIELDTENRLENATHALEMNDLDASGCNESQKNVIKECVKNRITLVKGPPGTGKTFTSAELVFNLFNTRKEDESKIWVCAQSNVAVDNLAIKIVEMFTNINVVRIRSFKSKKSKTTKLTESMYLDACLMTEKGEPFHSYRILLAEEEKMARCDPALMEKSPLLRELEEDCERRIINKADVLCTTCCGASRLNKLFDGHLDIDSLIIDECSQVSQPEALLPVRFCPRRIVVVGDDKQLGVTINHDIRNNLPMYTDESVSLFSLLKEKGFEPMLLDVQYRMHPALVEFSNRKFYGNKIKTGLHYKDRQWPIPNQKSPFPKQDMPIYFHCHNHQETKDAKTYSRYNEGEVDIVVETIKVLLSRGIDGDEIGVITPYISQCKKIKERLSQLREDLANTNKESRRKRRSKRRAKNRNKKFITDFDHIEVATVDAYQGREKDYIILSMVRSLERGCISFVADGRRFNVSLTRARFGMIVIGNPAVLKREPLLDQYIRYLSGRGLLYNTVLSEKSKSITLATFERLYNCIKIPKSFPKSFVVKKTNV